MSIFDEKAKSAFAATGTGTNAGASATKVAPSDLNRQYAITDAAASSDAAALVTIESPSGTVLWQVRHAAAFEWAHIFSTPLFGAAGQAAIVKVSASTSHAEANIGGFVS